MWKYSVVVSPNYDLIKYCLTTDAIGALVVGHNHYALRCNGDFTLEMIEALVKASHKPIVVNLNKLYHNDQLDELRAYVQSLNQIGVKYLCVADLGVCNLIDELGLKFEVIYNTETTITNHYFSTLSSWLGFSGIEVAKEITLKEIEAICQQKASIVGMSGHGQLYMYQSVRPLISNYQTIQQHSFELGQEFYLYDQERDRYYPVIENEQGTHILASNDLCVIHKLNDLMKLNLDYVKLDSFLYKNSDFLVIVKLYVEAYNEMINEPESYKQHRKNYLQRVEAICNYKTYSTGFLYKRTIY